MLAILTVRKKCLMYVIINGKFCTVAESRLKKFNQLWSCWQCCLHNLKWPVIVSQMHSNYSLNADVSFSFTATRVTLCCIVQHPTVAHKSTSLYSKGLPYPCVFIYNATHGYDGKRIAWQRQVFRYYQALELRLHMQL